MNFNRLIIADDFGFNHDNDKAMLDLCNASQIDGVSLFPKYISDEHVNSLLVLRASKNIKIGLHFNLTMDDNKKNLVNVQKLLIQSFFGFIDKKLIAKEFDEQLNTFKDKFNCYPDFIDGHEHVHAFPIIGKIIYAKLNKLGYGGLVRYVGSRSIDILLRSIKYHFFFKFLTLEIISVNQQMELCKNNLMFNKKFDGLLPRNPSTKISNILNEIYSKKNLDSTLIMCHPGFQEKELSGNFFFNKDRSIETNFLMNK